MIITNRAYCVVDKTNGKNFTYQERKNVIDFYTDKININRCRPDFVHKLLSIDNVIKLCEQPFIISNIIYYNNKLEVTTLITKEIIEMRISDIYNFNIRRYKKKRHDKDFLFPYIEKDYDHTVYNHIHHHGVMNWFGHSLDAGFGDFHIKPINDNEYEITTLKTGFVRIVKIKLLFMYFFGLSPKFSK